MIPCSMVTFVPLRQLQEIVAQIGPFFFTNWKKLHQLVLGKIPILSLRTGSPKASMRLWHCLKILCDPKAN